MGGWSNQPLPYRIVRMDIKSLKLDEVYQVEAERISEAARRKESIIHSSGDVRAAGDEVEQTVRDVIAGRLPIRYRTTHGHILDYTGKVSPQLDVIITDNLSSKSLFATSNGTEYAPFESVYAIGEIKSAYDKSKKPIQSFSSTISKIQTDLTRLRTSKHPILSFMVFASSKEFSVEDVSSFYLETPVTQLPSFVCLLEQGTILRGRFLRNDLNEPVFTQYYPCPAIDAKGDENDRWSIIHWCDEPRRAGGNLMFLHLALSEHLLRCAPSVLNLETYLMKSLNWNTGVIFEP